MLLGSSGCARPEYWVKGLTLPAGSTVKSRTESETKNSDSKPKFGEPPDGTLMIYFDSTDSWEHVAASIGDSLKKEGYVEQANKLAGLGDKLPTGGLPGGGMLKDMAKGFLDTTRAYRKPGSDYSVSLTNMKSILESKIYSQLKKFRKEGEEPKGQYMLLVVKRKGSGDAASGSPQVQPVGK
jgi:hypothetical protein